MTASCKTLARAVIIVLFAALPVRGDDPEQITRDGTFKFAPCFVPPGDRIVYSSHNVPNRVSLVRFNLQDRSEELLYPTLADHQLDAAYSADGRYHCFSQSSGSPQLLLVIKDRQEQTENVFRPDGARSTARGARFDPRQDRIVFTISQPGGQQIAAVDLRGGQLTWLTRSEGTNCWPAISPDGSQIAFSSSRDGYFSIYVMDADGDNVRRLTRSGSRDMRPAWSPDGSRIAFTSTRDGNHEIYVMNGNGAAAARITNHPERDDYATWHLDGRRLLTVSQRNGRYDLYLFGVPAAE